MIEPAGSAEKLAYTIDSKGWVSIGQVRVRKQTKSRSDLRPVNLQQIGRKAMLSSSARIGETRLCITWQKTPCHRNIVKDISLKSGNKLLFAQQSRF